MTSAERALLQGIVDKLGVPAVKVRRRPHGVTVLCPSHDDRQTPNLDIDIKGDTVVYICRAGCAQDVVTAALRARNITSADLSLNGHRATGQPEEVTSHYRYEDAGGALIAEKVVTRFLPKGDRKKKVLWRRPDPHRPGEWIYNLDGVAPRLYRHAELVEEAERCASAGRPFVLYLPEGEQCADDLRNLGLVATTWPNGSGGWKGEYADAIATLRPDRVIVLPDADDPGETVAARAVADFTQRALPVTLLRLPGLRPGSGDDISDWCKAGHTREELEELATKAAGAEAETAPGPSRSSLGIGLGQFLMVEDPEIEPFVDGIFSADGGGWIGGEEKTGKTYYALEEALCLSLGIPVCGKFEVRQRRRVLFVEEEDSPRRTRARLRALLRGHGYDPADVMLRAELDAWFRLAVWTGFTFDSTACVELLRATIEDFRPAVVYVDVLRKVTLRDLNKADQASALLATLDALRREYDVLPRILHHFRKVQGFRTGRGSQEMSGSFALGAWGENSLFFEPIGRKQGAVRIEVQSKDGAPTAPFRLVIEAEGPRHAPTLVRLRAEEDRGGEDVDDAVVQAVATLSKTEASAGRPGVSVQALATAMKKSEKTIRRSLKRLQGDGRVEVTGQAAKGKDLYDVPEPPSVSANAPPTRSGVS